MLLAASITATRVGEGGLEKANRQEMRVVTDVVEVVTAVGARVGVGN